MIQRPMLGVARVALLCLLPLLLGACGLLGGSPTAEKPAAEASPTLLPPPKPISSPEPGVALSPGLIAPGSPSPVAPPTPVPPPDLNAKPQASAAVSGGPRATVANTEGQGANMRAEPAATARLIRTVKEGTELEVIGDEREAGGRTWRNVRDSADGSVGWIVSELLAISEPPAAAPPQAAPSPVAKPAGEPKPATEGSPAPQPKPSGSPAAGAPAASGPPGAAKPGQRIGDEDRAYLGALQGPVDALGTAISSANEQIERAGGKPDIASDPAWRRDTEAVIQSLRDASSKIRAAKPGPSTAPVQRYALNAADRADEAADGLSAALNSGDTRGLTNVRTTLVRMLAEINNMNLTLLDLQ
ncbi:MAG: SH3 domain-containing protein [Chloroflexi bacterium]|nr:SH3 domain-containing protein [Chloroflexota bacterium]